MNIFTVLFDAITLGVCILAVGCGKEAPQLSLPIPTPTVSNDTAGDPLIIATATPTPTSTPTPNPTVATYIFQNTNLCVDIKTWDPNTTTIKTYPSASNGPSYYLFRWDGVFIVDPPGGCGNGCLTTTTITRSNINGVVCTITVVNGQLTGVTP